MMGYRDALEGVGEKRDVDKRQVSPGSGKLLERSESFQESLSRNRGSPEADWWRCLPEEHIFD